MEKLEVIFTETVSTVTLGGLFQWDCGQKLYIKGLNLNEVEEIHFSNGREEETLVRPLVKEGECYTCTIPDETLQNPQDITAWVYDVGNDSGKTIRRIILKVEPRKKPENFVENHPDAEIMLKDVINKINQNIEDNAEFKKNITTDNTQFKGNLTQQQTTFETNITQRQTNFETSIQNQQDQHVKDVNSLVDQRLSGVYRYCGQVATKNDLPTGAKVGDVYDVADSGVNWAWNGNSWDSLAGIIDLTNYYTKEQTDTKLGEKANTTDVNTALNLKSDKGHNHDDRYSTEAEINAKLGTQVTYTLSGTTLTITTK